MNIAAYLAELGRMLSAQERAGAALCRLPFFSHTAR